MIGLDSFREKFKDYTDCYTIIGGTACEILMAEQNFNFRATKDVDIIILLEDKYQDFAKVFWDYIQEGEYLCGWRNSEEMHFYRFTEPKAGYPVQIELFSKNSNYRLMDSTEIIPIYIDDKTSNLSAILLNDDFYSFMMDGRTVRNGIAILEAEYIIPFKMYAWINLREEKRNNKHVNDRDLKKHRNDVFRMLQIVNATSKVEVQGLVAQTVETFIRDIEHEDIPFESLGIDLTKDESMALLKSIYVKL